MKEAVLPKLSLKLVRLPYLPSGVEKLIDSRCRATIGIVYNPNHGARKLRKAGQSRWLGRRPIIRGVAINPVDHPHGGGEGRTKGGRPSVSPWGKPTKAGFRVGVEKGRNEFMPRRSIWKGSFVDAFLLRMKKKRDRLLNRKVFSTIWRVCSYMETKTFENKKIEARSLRVGGKSSLSAYGTKRKSDFRKTWEES